MSKKLVEELAENLVLELIDTGALDLTNNEKFGEFTDLLYEILDKEEINQKTNDELTETHFDILELCDTIKEYFADVKDRLDKTHDELLDTHYHVLEISDKMKAGSGGGSGSKGSGNGTNNIANSKINRITTLVESLSKDVGEIKKKIGVKEKEDKKSFKERAVETKKLSRSVKNAEKRNERKNRRTRSEMRRGFKDTKQTIKESTGKIWSRFKKLLTIGLLFIFGPLIKRIFQGVKDSTESYWKPLAKWLQENMPTMYNWIKKVAEAIGDLADLVLNLKKFFEFFQEHKEGFELAGAAGTGASLGIAVGSAFGPLGMIIGGVLGGGVGFLAGKLFQSDADENEFNEGEYRKSIQATLSANTMNRSDLNNVYKSHKMQTEDARKSLDDFLAQNDKASISADEDLQKELNERYRRWQKMAREQILLGNELLDNEKLTKDDKSDIQSSLNTMYRSYKEFDDKTGAFDERYNYSQNQNINTTVVQNIQYIQPNSQPPAH